MIYFLFFKIKNGIFCVQNLKSLAQKMTEFWQLVQKSTNIFSIIIVIITGPPGNFNPPTQGLQNGEAF